eukprot:m.273994 g.273994  ORF g.273994 m.273994 type:complete len:272 (+) comp40581_c0_seq22:789-1604(+)
MSSYSIITVPPTDVFNSYLWDYLVVDLRSVEEYDKSHLDRAESWSGETEKHEQQDVVIFYDKDGTVCKKPSDLDKKQFERFGEMPLTRCVWLLEGGYDRFHEEYMFMCSDCPDCDTRLCYPQRITEHIFLGSRTCADEEEIFKNLKLTHVLNCTAECRDHFEDSASVPVTYYRISVEDSLSENLSPHFEVAVSFLENVRQSSGRVLVHCSRGVSRSAAFVIAYLIKNNQWTLDTALKYVKERRSVVSPNPSFIVQLEEYAHHCGISDLNSS